MDGLVVQSLDIGSSVRRGRTLAGSDGYYAVVLRNIHAAANTVSSSERPFNPRSLPLNAYPAVVPPQLDIWLIGASVVRISGTGTYACKLDIDTVPGQQGWGTDSANNAVVSSLRQAIGVWDQVTTINDTFVTQADGKPYLPIGIRLPRHIDTLLVFSGVSSAAITVEAQIILGVFPVALGQDIAT